MSECESGFYYTVSQSDINQARSPHIADVKHAIAFHLDVNERDIIRGTYPEMGITVRPGEVFCIQGEQPQGYIPPEEQARGILDAVIIQQLFGLMDYADALALIAEQDTLLVEPEPDVTANTDGFLDENTAFARQIARNILELACWSQYPDSDGAISDLLRVSYNDDFCDQFAFDIRWLDTDATSATVNALLSLHERVYAYATEFDALTHELEHPDETFQHVDWDFEPESIMDEVQQEYQLFQAATQQDASDTEAVTARNEAAAAENALLIQKLEAIRPVIEEWQTVREQEKSLLNSLNEKIHVMHHEALTNIYVGDIINTFQRYHDNVKTRYGLLEQIADNTDFEYLDLLRMTPEERQEYARQQHWLQWLQDMGIPYDFPEDIEDPATFDSYVVSAIYLGLNDEQVRINLMDAGLLDISDADYLAYRTHRGQPDAEQAPAARDIDPIQLFDSQNPSDLPDPLATKRFWNNVEQTAEIVFFVAGFIPVVGTFIDIADAVIAISQGHYGDAFISAFFAVIDIDDLYRLASRVGSLTSTAENILARVSIEEIAEHSPTELLSNTRRKVSEFEEALITIGNADEYPIYRANDHAHAHGFSIRNVNPQYESIEEVGISAYNINCSACVIATDRTLHGIPTTVYDIIKESGISGQLDDISTYNDMIAFLSDQYNGNWIRVFSYEEIENLLNDLGSGASGIVLIDRGQQNVFNHVFNAINQGGEIRFLDGQIGAAATLEENFRNLFFLWTNKP